MTTKSARRLLSAIAIALVCSGCSPIARVFVRLIVPGGTSVPTSSLKFETSGEPTPGPARYASDTPYTLEPSKNGWEAVFHFRGSVAYVYLLVWADLNGNGAKDGGDFVGSLPHPPFVASDRGLFRGNDNRAPDIVLARLP